MGRWERAFTKSDKDIFGVKNEVFLKMLAVLQVAYQERHRNGGRPPKLPVSDKLLLAVQYWREYRTMAHLASDTVREE